MQAKVNRHLASRSIGNQHWYREGIDPRWPSGSELVVLFMHRVESADTSPQHHGYPGCINGADGR